MIVGERGIIREFLKRRLVTARQARGQRPAKVQFRFECDPSSAPSAAGCRNGISAISKASTPVCGCLGFRRCHGSSSHGAGARITSWVPVSSSSW
jgi:hypothetical protein